MQHPTYASSSDFNEPKVCQLKHSALRTPKEALKGKDSRKRQGKMYTLLSLGISLSLSGCMGIYEEGFECPPGKGVGCKSISEVNHMVNEGSLGRRVVKEAPSRGSHSMGSPLMGAPSMGHLSQGTYDQSASSVSSNCGSCTSLPMVQGLSSPCAMSPNSMSLDSMSTNSMSSVSSGEPQIWYAPIQGVPIQWAPSQRSSSKMAGES